MILDHVKCIKLFVLNADKNVKFHSNLQKANQFTVENVIEREEGFKIFFKVFGLRL